MSEAEQREAVLAEAESWIGTAFHHAARIKVKRDATGKIIDRGGVDCAMLLALVYEAAGVIDPIAVAAYPADWHQNQAAERYLGTMLSNAREIECADVKPGDAILAKWGRLFSHGGIVAREGWPTIIHAFQAAGMVLPEKADTGTLSGCAIRFFTLW